MWKAHEIQIVGLDDGASAGDLVTVVFDTPAGRIIAIGAVSIADQTLSVRGLSIQGAAANAVGLVNLRILIRHVLERLDCHEARIEGALRTTGANPGHAPRVIRVTRNTVTHGD